MDEKEAKDDVVDLEVGVDEDAISMPVVISDPELTVWLWEGCCDWSCCGEKWSCAFMRSRWSCCHPDPRICCRVACCPGQVCCWKCGTAPLSVDCWEFPCERESPELQQLSARPYLRVTGTWACADYIDIKWAWWRVFLLVCELAITVECVYHGVLDGFSSWFFYWSHISNVTLTIYFFLAVFLTFYARYERRTRGVYVLGYNNTEVMTHRTLRWLVPSTEMIIIIIQPIITFSTAYYWIEFSPSAFSKVDLFGQFTAVLTHGVCNIVMYMDTVPSYHRLYYKSTMVVMWFVTLYIYGLCLTLHLSGWNNSDEFGGSWIYPYYDFSYPLNTFKWYIFSAFLLFCYNLFYINVKNAILVPVVRMRRKDFVGGNFDSHQELKSQEEPNTETQALL